MIQQQKACFEMCIMHKSTQMKKSQIPELSSTNVCPNTSSSSCFLTAWGVRVYLCSISEGSKEYGAGNRGLAYPNGGYGQSEDVGKFWHLLTMYPEGATYVVKWNRTNCVPITHLTKLECQYVLHMFLLLYVFASVTQSILCTISHIHR